MQPRGPCRLGRRVQSPAPTRPSPRRAPTCLVRTTPRRQRGAPTSLASSLRARRPSSAAYADAGDMRAAEAVLADGIARRATARLSSFASCLRCLARRRGRWFRPGRHPSSATCPRGCALLRAAAPCAWRGVIQRGRRGRSQSGEQLEELPGEQRAASAGCRVQGRSQSGWGRERSGPCVLMVHGMLFTRTRVHRINCCCC
jgi:hypothetical protein